jgi:hypothetical protein
MSRLIYLDLDFSFGRGSAANADHHLGVFSLVGLA